MSTVAMAGTDSRQANDTTRVLFVHPSYPNQFTAIASALNKHHAYKCYGLVYQSMLTAVNHDNDVPHFGFCPDEQLTAQSYPFTSGFESGIRNARGITYALANIQRGLSFDAVVGHASFGGSIFLKPLLNCATIAYVELPGYQALAARPMFPITADQALAGQSLEALNYLSVLHNDLCIVPSSHAKRTFPLELQHKIRVQMEGFDVDHVPVSSRQARKELGWPVDKPMVGFFSRTLEAVRGFDIFLQVAKRLYELAPEIRFVVIGEEKTLYGNESAYIKGQSFARFALAQAGVPKELFWWYPLMPYEQFRQHIACLDLVILPLFEGAANWSLFEAMALGKPILTSNRCYIPEAIRNGFDGILLDPADVEGFARQALALLRDPRRARLLGRSAQSRIRHKFSVSRAVEGYRLIIEEAIDRHRACRQKQNGTHP